MKRLKISRLQLLCCLVYFMSYVTRIDYAAVLAEIVNDLGVTKQAASIAVTGSFITYGVGQIISGILGDKIRPTKLIFVGLVCTSVINLMMTVLPGLTAMTAVWCFNGFFQALLWPPMVKLMAQNMDSDEYSRSCVNVSAAASVATIAVYMLAPALIGISGWRSVFAAAAAGGLIMAFVWLHGTKGLKEGAVVRHVGEVSAAQGGLWSVAGLLIPVMAAIALQGILRDGITTWMPTYIYEVFDMGVSMSILTTTILPVFAIFSVNVAAKLESRIRNELKTAAVLFGTGLIAAAAMIPMFSTSVMFCALMMALITACMHGVNLMLISRLPVYFGKFGKVSTVSGLLNACTYVGAALSTYGFAVLSDRFGWGFTIASWAVVAAGGTAICALLIRKWKLFSAN